MADNPPSGDGTQAQILLELGKMNTKLAVMDTKLDAIPDHEARIRSLEHDAAQDSGASRAKASLWTAGVSLVAAGSALAVVLIHR